MRVSRWRANEPEHDRRGVAEDGGDLEAAGALHKHNTHKRAHQTMRSMMRSMLCTLLVSSLLFPLHCCCLAAAGVLTLTSMKNEFGLCTNRLSLCCLASNSAGGWRRS